jgi:hypothetical protein
MMNLPTIDTSERLIHGSLLKCVDGRWSTQDNPEMTGRQLLALTTAKAIQRWQLKEPVETVVDTGTGLPDIDDGFLLRLCESAAASDPARNPPKAERCSTRSSPRRTSSRSQGRHRANFIMWGSP